MNKTNLMISEEWQKAAR